MRKRIIFITVIFLFSTLTFSQNIISKGFSAKTVENETATFSDFQKSEVTMINIWGTFCGSCIREMPELAEISNEYKNKNFQIIGIVLDVADTKGNLKSKKITDAKNIISQTKVPYKNLVPTKTMLEGFLSNIYAVPTTIFVDKNGNQIGKSLLGSRLKSEWIKIIDEKLKAIK